MVKKYQLYIGGKFVDPNSHEWFGSKNPYTQEKWAEIPRGDSEDVDLAVGHAQDTVFGGKWSSYTATERGKYLFEIAQKLEENVQSLAEVDVKETGRPIQDVEGHVTTAAEVFRFYGGLADKIQGSTVPHASRNTQVFTRKEPIGVVGAIIPWNTPLMLVARKVAPALAAGNSIVLKPDEHASASSLEFADILTDIGLPDGVINVITGLGEEVGQELTTNNDVDKISFTGGTTTGSRIAATTGKNITQSTLELGGKSPNIVFADVDIPKVVDAAIEGIFPGSGQTCSAWSRLLLHEDIYDEFIDLLVKRTQDLKMGDPHDANTDMGPIGTKEQFKKVTEFIATGMEEATLKCGGLPSDDGQFIPPTIFTDVDSNSQLAQEEIFGPVLSVLQFKDEQEAIKMANDVKFGLVAAVWSENINRAHRVANALRVGRVWINDPKNSTITAPQEGHKDSGWGPENGAEAIEEFTKLKTIYTSLPK